MGKCHKSVANLRADGKIAIITGANTGIGFETAKHLAQGGAKVYLLCRSVDKANAAVDQMVESGCDRSRLHVIKCDLSSFASVRQAAEELLEKEPIIDIFIANAGIFMFPKYEKTVDGHELVWQSNFLGHFLLTELLLPAIKKSENARIVIVASELAKQSDKLDLNTIETEEIWGRLASYNRSKLANIMHARELDRRLRDQGITNITVNSLHPGVVTTEVTRHVVSENSNIFYRMGFAIWKQFTLSPQDGAKCSIYVALSPEISDVTGKYFDDCKVKKEPKFALEDEECAKLYDYAFTTVGLEKISEKL